jgi:hypothetical protein
MSLVLPKKGKSEEYHFELELPSVNEISKLKRRRFKEYGKESGDFPKEFSLCIEEEAEPMSYGDVGQGPKSKPKGELMQPVLAEVVMRPCEIRDIKHKELSKLTEG